MRQIAGHIVDAMQIHQTKDCIVGKRRQVECVVGTWRCMGDVLKFTGCIQNSFERLWHRSDQERVLKLMIDDRKSFGPVIRHMGQKGHLRSAGFALASNIELAVKERGDFRNHER